MPEADLSADENGQFCAHADLSRDTTSRPFTRAYKHKLAWLIVSEEWTYPVKARRMWICTFSKTRRLSCLSPGALSMSSSMSV